MRDLTIVGGGPVGLAAALAAASQGIDVLVLDAQHAVEGSDPRVFALSYGARLILERLDVWRRIQELHPIRAVHVSQRGAIGHTVLRARELGIDALGYVIAQAELMRSLRDRLAETGIERLAGAFVTAIEDRGKSVAIRFESAGAVQVLETHVVAQADGGSVQKDHARAIERRYEQCALTAEVRCTRVEQDYAYERFTSHGPIALLPLRDRHALIWTVPETEADRLRGLSDAHFEHALLAGYGERLGAVRVLGPRATFPLHLRFVRHVAGTRTVLIGNAAQTLHPVAGQGFNLGLRDAFELARSLAECVRERQDLTVGLRRYRSRRRVDRAGGTFFTDFLVRAFSNDDPLLAVARSTGLILLDCFGPAKKLLMRRMIYGGSG